MTPDVPETLVILYVTLSPSRRVVVAFPTVTSYRFEVGDSSAMAAGVTAPTERSDNIIARTTDLLRPGLRGPRRRACGPKS
jgi:hypothetical protein